MAVKDKLVTLEDLGVAYSDVKADFTQLEQNKADIIINSASGAIASFSDGANYPVKQTVFTMNPVQDLHGQEYPWAGGASKNIVPMTFEGIKARNTGGTWNGNAYTQNGLTFTVDADDGGNVHGISVSGTSIASTSLILEQLAFYLEAESYVISGLTNTGESATFRLILTNSEHTGSKKQAYSTNGESFSLSTADYFGFQITISNGVTLSNEKFYPMICLSSASNPTVFAPYSNICPILGHTEVDAHVSPTTDSADGTTVTYTLGQTVYAGTLTINDDGSGQIVSTMASVDLGTLNWSKATLYTNPYFTAVPTGSATGIASDIDSMCSNYKTIRSLANSTFANGDYDKCICHRAGNVSFMVKDSTYNDSDASAFKTAMNGVQLVYELATPVTIQLTEQEVIETLYGNNNVWHDANGNTEVSYRADTKKYIDNKFAELQTLIANS